MTPIEKLTKEIKDHEEADKEEFAKVKSIIHEMILKAIPKEIATEATQKRFEEPINLMLLIMIKYQPGSKREKEAILQQIGSPEAGWNEEKAFSNLKIWKRKIDRAKELGLVIPDPAVLIVALDTITEKVIAKDARRKFRIDTARESLKVDILANAESLEKFSLVLESELEDMVTASWQTVTVKVKTMKGTPKGKGKGKGKDGKGKDGKGKSGKTEECYYFAEHEEGCKHGQQCTRYHRMLKPEERRCYTCGSKTHMAGDCDRPKKEDSLPKGGKDD
jgi:hypothetical protein